MKKEIKGDVDGIKYTVDESIVKRAKETKNIDVIKEIEEALKKFKEQERNKDAN